MNLTRTRRTGAVLTAGVLALALAACGSDDNESTPTTSPGGDATTTPGGDPTEEPPANLSGNLPGGGASSQGTAIEGWVAGFNDTHPDVIISYDPGGSSQGRSQFLSGGYLFAGSDSPLKPEEVEEAQARCFGGEAIEFPLYISPIAVIYNLPSVDAEHINFTPETLAQVFNGDITNWSDPAIAADNPGVDLPDLDIIPVNRIDDSGTTNNFTQYLAAAAGDAWPHEASESWPRSGTQSGQGTQGMVDTVSGAEGAIGYADASRAGTLGTAAIKVGDEFVPYSPEAAAAVVDASPRAETATDKRLTVDIDRTTTAAGAYPLVLISYSIACDTYDNASDAANVQAFLSYIASEEGQARAAEPSVAGSAPISAELRAEVEAVLSTISSN